MELPKDLLAILEEFWTEEYESDYRRFIEKPASKNLDEKHL